MLSFVPPDGKFTLLTYRVLRTNYIPIYVTPNISFSQSHATGSRSEHGIGFEGLGGRASTTVDSGTVSVLNCESGVCHLSVTIGSRPTDGRSVEEVSCRIPLPPSTLSASLTASVGSVVFDATGKEVRIPERSTHRFPLISPDCRSSPQQCPRLLLSQVRWQIGKLPKDKLPVLTGTVALGAGRSARELSLSMFLGFRVTSYSASGLKVAALRIENEEHQPYKGVRSITRAGRFEVRC